MATYQIGNATRPNCVTGESNHLYPYLKDAISRASEIDMNVSFLMVSGIKLLLDDLKTAADHGGSIRILCANYLTITQPEARYLLKDTLGDRLGLRFYKVPDKSFHAKAYFFKYANYEEIFVGSSNLSKSAPFRYYGIFDDMNYDQIDFRNGRYDDDQLAVLASVNKRGKLIFQNYAKYASHQALGFCINRKHALYMTGYFRKQGIACCAVISGAVHEAEQDLLCDREIAIKNLKSGKIQVIFSVDMFNEGVDIRELDMVMFLRPTQSPTIFLQQLGRGLRKAPGKKHVDVLDFIMKARCSC